MICRLIFDDWRKDGKSIYNTELGIQLSMGDLHHGTIFDVDLNFDDPDIETEIKAAKREHNVEPVFVVRSFPKHE